ncbi:MAG: DUF4136 domain-containing protein [Steroidobacteraceae bacterium]
MSNKRVLSSLLLCVTALLLAACSTPRVRSDYNAKLSIGNYHSYVWEQAEIDATTGGPAFNNPLNEQRLRDAIDAQLAANGLQLAEAGATPDSYVTLAIGTRQAINDRDRSPVRVGFGFGTWGPRFGSSIYMSDVGGYNYREGRVTLDFYDAATRKPIWHATVEQDLTYMTGDSAQKRINQLVDAMFAKFPGKVSK